MSGQMTMRYVCIGLAVLTTAVVAAASVAEAKDPRPYCFRGGRGSPGGGLDDCSYVTWEQCMATVAGAGEGCHINPELLWRAIEARRAGVPVQPYRPPRRR